MIELPFIFISGLLSSAHCIGMCGGFAATVGVGSGCFSNNLKRQIVYSIGRIFTYAFLGAIAGFAGVYLTQHLSSVKNIHGILSILAGVLLVQQGLQAAGWFPSLTSIGKLGTSFFRSRKKKKIDPFALPILKEETSACVSSSFFASYLNGPGMKNVFIAGIMTGFLPCGLVYAFLAFATRAETLAGGMVVMILFGLGTVPALLLTGTGVGMLTMMTRQKLIRIAAICVVLMGLLTISRGVGHVNFSDSQERSGCPLCIKKNNN